MVNSKDINFMIKKGMFRKYYPSLVLDNFKQINLLEWIYFIK